MDLLINLLRRSLGCVPRQIFSISVLQSKTGRRRGSSFIIYAGIVLRKPVFVLTKHFSLCSGNEVSASYIQALSHQDRPSVIILTRQNLPHLAGSSIEAASKGAYTVLKEKDLSKLPAVIIAATGSEVSIAVDAAGLLATKGVDGM